MLIDKNKSQVHDEPAALRLESFLDFGLVLKYEPELPVLRHPHLIDHAVPLAPRRTR
jgi:hypothetical protein